MAKRKTKLVQVYVPPEKHAKWKAAADSSGLNLSDWVRLRCDGSVLEAIPPSKVA